MEASTRQSIDRLKIHGANLQVARLLSLKLELAQKSLAQANSIAWAMKASENPTEFSKAWKHGDLRDGFQAVKDGIAEAEEILKEIQPL